MSEQEGATRRGLFLGGAVVLAGAAAFRASAQTTSIALKSSAPPQPSPGDNAQPPVTPALISTSGLERSKATERLWNIVQGQIPNLALYDPASGNIAKHDFLTRIEAGFVFQPETEDVDLMPLHVEPLLDQAADLFDRGIRDRVLHDDLAAKAFELTLELTEYSELDKIHREEEAAGLYNVDANLSRSQLDAEQKMLFRYNLAGVSANSASSLHSASWNTVYNAQRQLSWTTGLLAYTFRDQTFGGYVQHNVMGTQRTISDTALDATEKLAFNGLMATHHALNIQTQTIAATKDSTAARVGGLRSKADWDNQNVGFRRRRTIAARNRQDVRSYAAVAEDGILNYWKRTPSLRARFHADFRNALARMIKAAVGLQQVYGYTEPLPQNQQSLDYYDDCLLWTREAVHWLIRFARQEQSAVIPISLRELLGENVYKAQRKAGNFSFALPTSLFAGLAHVRLRGLAAYVWGDDDDDGDIFQKRPRLWSARVHLPTTAQAIHLDRSVHALDQSKLPPCLFNRINRRAAIRDPDVFGSSMFHNASPIGTWRLSLLRAMPRVRNFDEVYDVELDLFTAFRALK